MPLNWGFFYLTMYKYQDVLQSTLQYFNDDDLAAKVWIDKYALRDSSDNLLEMNPNDMHRRLAKEFARIEAKKFKEPLSENHIYSLLEKFKYIVPQGSPMYGIGNDYQYQSLGNCFTLGEHPYDSYGGILYADQMIVQLSKRRCVHEDSWVILKTGLKKIKDVEVGEEILTKQGYNKIFDKFSTYVLEDKRLEIITNKGILRVSDDHEVLVFDGQETRYIQGKDIIDNKDKYYLINNLKNFESPVYDEELSEKAWYIGAYLGDGSSNYVKNRGTYGKKRIRLRINGDNKQLLDKYSKITNKIFDKNINVCVDNAKRYKSKVWKVCCYFNNKQGEDFNNLIENQNGKKTYSGFIPSFITKNNLYIPFLAGLIDTDGYVNGCGAIYIDIAAKRIIDELCCYLSSIGVSFYFTKKISKRINEQPIYRLKIYNSNLKFINLITKYLSHDKKIEKLKNLGKSYSISYPLSDIEYNDILNKFNSSDKSNFSNNFSNSFYYMKRTKKVGLPLLNMLLENKIIDEEKYFEIQQRSKIKSIKYKCYDGQFYDLSIDKHNNFYTGNFGQLNVHNCGVGLCLDNIRPKGMSTKNAAKTTDGLAVFMERFSNSTREVAQSGRRGALLEGLSVHHPEIETFINIKRDLKKVTGANISVLLTDEFMNAVINDDEYEQRWPINGKKQISKKVKARYIWDQIIDSAWFSAEPGILFLDNARKYGLSHQYSVKDKRFADIITNPCGELWIGLDSCRLLLIVLYSYVVNPFTKEAYFDFDLFSKHCQISQRLMDDMVDLEIEKIERIIEKVSNDPEPQLVKQVELDMWKNYLETAKLGRRTGLGITALADCLAALNIKYGSEESVDMTEKIYKCLGIESLKSSCLMAKELGSFPIYDSEIEKEHPFLERLFNCDNELRELHNKYGRRNISLTTTAPAGSVSILTQSSSGIEPVFLLEYKRRKKINKDNKNSKTSFVDKLGDSWEEYIVRHHALDKWSKINNDIVVENSPYFKATSNDIDWKTSVRIQAVAQKYISHSISKTCNVPNNISKELVAEIYLEAYKQGCKGFTIYRDGCRDGVLVQNKENKKEIIKNHAPKRDKTLNCDIYSVKVKGEKFFVIIGLLNGPYEVFAGRQDFELDKLHSSGKIEKVKRGQYKLLIDNEVVCENVCDHLNDEEEIITRLVSTGLRHSVDLNFLVHQIEKSQGALNSLGKAIARCLKKYLEDGIEVTGEDCPECGGKLQRKEGCASCQCGFSKCG